MNRSREKFKTVDFQPENVNLTFLKMILMCRSILITKTKVKNFPEVPSL